MINWSYCRSGDEGRNLTMWLTEFVPNIQPIISGHAAWQNKKGITLVIPFIRSKKEFIVLQTLQTWFLCHHLHAPNKDQQEVSKYLIV